MSGTRTVQRKAYSYQRNGRTVHVPAHPARTRAARPAPAPQPVPLRTIIGGALGTTGLTLSMFTGGWVSLLGVLLTLAAVPLTLSGMFKMAHATDDDE